MTRFLATLAMAAIALGAQPPSVCPASDTVSFIVDGYYFELNLGAQREDHPGHAVHEFYAVESLSASPVARERFRHVLRLELPTDGTTYQSIDVSRATRARSVWNPSKRLLAAAFDGRAIIMSPDYSILKCYRNAELLRWIDDVEILASVETNRPARYDREEFIINVETDAVRKAGAVALATTGVKPGAMNAPIDRIIVEKSKRTMKLLRQQQEVAVYRVALGRDPVGPKVMRGDNKTPEGLYFVDYKIRNSVYHRALHLTYPNLDDLARADSLGVSAGNDITIHGMSTKQLWMGDVQYLFDWTNGCIALTNSEIEQIWELVPLWTPVEIRP